MPSKHPHASTLRAKWPFLTSETLRFPETTTCGKPRSFWCPFVHDTGNSSRSPFWRLPRKRRFQKAPSASTFKDLEGLKFWMLRVNHDQSTYINIHQHTRYCWDIKYHTIGEKLGEIKQPWPKKKICETFPWIDPCVPEPVKEQRYAVSQETCGIDESLLEGILKFLKMVLHKMSKISKISKFQPSGTNDIRPLCG